jgi:hypothetical protein
MYPGAQIYDGCKLISVRLLPGREHQVQFRDEGMKFPLEVRQRFGHLWRIDAVMNTDLHLDFFKTGFTAECTHETRVGNG